MSINVLQRSASAPALHELHKSCKRPSSPSSVDEPSLKKFESNYGGRPEPRPTSTIDPESHTTSANQSALGLSFPSGKAVPSFHRPLTKAEYASFARAEDLSGVQIGPIGSRLLEAPTPDTSEEDVRLYNSLIAELFNSDAEDDESDEEGGGPEMPGGCEGTGVAVDCGSV